MHRGIRVAAACLPTCLCAGVVVGQDGLLGGAAWLEAGDEQQQGRPVAVTIPYTEEAWRSDPNWLYRIQDSEDDRESQEAKQLIQPIAEKIIAKCKAKEKEHHFHFFVPEEDDMIDFLQGYTNPPEAAPLLTTLDMSTLTEYVMDVEEITPAIVEAFVNTFLAEKFNPEPI
ncbi:PREDICTED: LOW QUALITY PROTEIN: nucleoredoxin-like [Mandrillus leucophaeus]|uniref:LOW QUALITY PROTEIN: nucleoredoxin-like n=1 Tax=Mandrillus leucophaeus TaxID=9568 RepID=UPI0005F4D38A|nr:PREDICTED: LOW QUALITY PROTEIN: nucleoredoxin-like [Mandrillus leucophaeus]